MFNNHVNDSATPFYDSLDSETRQRYELEANKIKSKQYDAIDRRLCKMESEVRSLSFELQKFIRKMEAKYDV